jgi:DNA-binding transcriptional ArsR family regulator
MNTKDRILKLLGERTSATAKELAEATDISRQAASMHLRDLIATGAVTKEGVTKGARFRLAGVGEKSREQSVQKRFRLQGLEEDVVFRDFVLWLNLHRNVSKTAFETVNYAFTEILNNAIEHSRSDQCLAQVTTGIHDLHFQVRDYGIGIFHSIFSKFGLQDENAAVGELLKGKATTMSEHHSGEGIFFTSKAADRFVLRSHRIQLAFDRARDDIQVATIRNLKGTEARFTLSLRSKRKLDALFQEYAPEEFDYSFERTRVCVKLIEMQCVSRSAAKRLVARLQSFKEVVLDFRGIKSLGQAYADELFRVFMRAHPDVRLQLENLPPAFIPMVKHVLDASIARRVEFQDA